MTEFILIRHGEPRYDEVTKRGYTGMGYDMGRLSDTGILQAEKRADDTSLKGAEIIVSSPYTRALQTAAIISRITRIPLMVENDIHEWIPDTTFSCELDVKGYFKKYINQRGVPSREDVFESYDNLKKRVDDVLNKYRNFKKVIVVCHGIVISTQTHFDDAIEHCGLRKVYK